MAYDLETNLIHAPIDRRTRSGETVAGPFQSTGFEHETAEDIENVFAHKAFGYVYSRISNPTVLQLEQKLTALEKGIGALVTSSGMSAITCALLNILCSGDNFVCGNSLFGGSYSLFTEVFPRFGIESIFVESSDVDAYARSINEKTKAIFFEVIGNPKLDVPDIKKISQIAKNYRIPLILDNTLGCPPLFYAKKFGADIVIHSTSKYINGHGNAMGGAVIDCGTFAFDNPRFKDFQPFLKKFQRFAFLAKLRQQIFSNMGPCQAPQNAFLTLIGLETLVLRWKKHCDNALLLAKFLDSHKKVVSVNYPGLSSSPWHQTACSQFSSLFGGIVTFEVSDKKSAFDLINHRSFTRNLANIGDAKTLIIHPASTIYQNYSDERNLSFGVKPFLLRISVGLESSEDIIEDFDTALKSI